MAARAGTAFIEVRGDFSPFDKQVGRLAVTSRSRFARIGKVAAAGVAAGFAGGAVVVKKAMEEWVEAEKVSRQTAAALKSTGGQANVTARQIENLATSISRKAGIDDEAIQSAENLLLTFTKVRNETGRGNQIFGQATKAVVDMSAAMDQDLKSSTIQVGKALNDPIKGMTALQRVGVSFTQQQKDRVAGWVEEGNVLRAQKFILKELRTEFGGSAAAQATGFDRAKVAIDNMAESLGGFLGPRLEQAANQVAKFVNQIQTGKGAGGEFARQVKQIWTNAQPVVVAFGRAAAAVARFAAQHPNITKVATAVGLTALAFNKFKIGGAISAISSVVKVTAALPGRMQNALAGIRNLMSRILGRAGTAGGAALAENAASTAAGNVGGRFSRKSGAFRTAGARVGTTAGAAAGATMATQTSVVASRNMTGAVGQGGRLYKTAKLVGRGFGVLFAVSIAAELAGPIRKKMEEILGEFRVEGQEQFERSPGIDWLGDKFGFRRGGVTAAVPAMLSPGEVGITPGGGAFKVPGPRVAADIVPAALPPGTAIFTGDGQRRLRRGDPPADVLRRQAPHFRDGGIARFQRGGSAGWSRTPINVATDAARRAGGLKGRTLVNMVAIAGRESRWNPRAQNLKHPDHSIGLWQINQLAHKGRFGTDQQLMDPYVNAKAMGSLFKSSGYSPWVGVSYGNATQYLDEARRAVLATKGRSAGAGGGGGTRSFTRTTPAPTTFPLLGNMLDPLVDDALLGGIQAGMDRTGRRGRRQLLTQVLEGIVPESGDRATRERVDVDIPGARGGGGRGGADVGGAFGKAMAEARKLERARYPYVWGGGHVQPARATGGGYDCSGAVARVMQQGGFDFPTGVSGQYASWGAAGPGRKVTVYATPTHTFMRLGRSFFGTSRSNPGGGPGWLGTDYSTSGFTPRHPPGFRRGGVAGMELLEKIPKRKRTRKVIREFLRTGLMPGLRRGGVVTMQRGGIVGPGPGFGFEQWLRQLRKRKRKPTLAQLVSILGADQLGSRNADLTTRTLADRVAGRSIGSLIGSQKRIKDQIRRMAREGFTGPERIRTRRLRGGLSLLQDEMGRPIGRQLGASDRLQERLSRQESTLQDRLIVSGVDPESVEGLTAQRTETVSALGSLQVRRAGLAKALKRAKRTGNRQAVEQVQTEIREVDDQILGLKSSIEQLNKSILEAAPTATDFANRDLALAQLTDTLDDDRAALQNLEAIAQQQLQAALQTADPRDDIEAANNLKSIRDQLESLNASIQEQNSQIADLLRQQNEIEKQKLALAQTQGPQLFAAMMMIWNGGIGGRAGAGRSFPSFAGLGGVART